MPLEDTYDDAFNDFSQNRYTEAKAKILMYLSEKAISDAVVHPPTPVRVYWVYGYL